MNEKDVKSLFLLLEDPDPKVYEAIRSSIFEHLDEVKPYLEQSWVLSSDILYQERIQLIHDEIEAKKYVFQLQKWAGAENPQLFEALLIVERALFPEYDTVELPDAFRKIRHNIWMELTNSSTAIEKIKTMNQVLYNVFCLSKPVENVVKREHLCLSNVISQKTGDPLMQCLLYASLAQNLGMPVFVIALPDLFVLAYKDAFIAELTFATEKHYDVLFYIYPWEQGALFGRSVIDKYLEEKQLSPAPEFYTPADNVKTVHTYLAVLRNSFSLGKNTEKQQQIIRQMMNVLEPRL